MYLYIGRLQVSERAKERNHEKAKAMIHEEVDIVASADAVVAITETDAMTIHSVINSVIYYERKIDVIPFSTARWELVSPEQIPLLPGFKDRTGIIFVGNGRNPTNAHAVKWYLKHIAQNLNEQLVVAGSLIAPAVLPLTVIGGFWDTDEMFKDMPTNIRGYVDFKGYMDTTSMLELIDHHRVFISPMVVATGI